MKEKIFGILKIIAVFAVDFFIAMAFTNNFTVSAFSLVIIVIYTLIGGFINLMKEGAVRMDNLPACERGVLTSIKKELVNEVREKHGVDISNISFWLTPDEEANAASYGNNISVTQGLLDCSDRNEITSVIAHEIGHEVALDALVSRAVFASVFGAILFIGGIQAVVVFLFLLGAMLFCRSLFSILAFRGITAFINGIFKICKLSIVFVYKGIAALISREREYKADEFVCCLGLGYGQYLAHWLKLNGSEERSNSISDILYKTHPPAIKRISKIEAFCVQK